MDDDEQILQDVLGRLSGVLQRPGYWMAQCPAHEDRNPSLSVAEGRDARALLKCHAGCGLEAIVGAIELKDSDLFAKPKLTPNTRVASGRFWSTPCSITLIFF